MLFFDGNCDIIKMVKNMNTRMSKYDTNDYIDLSNMSRVKKNQDIYNSDDMSELSRFKATDNVSIISDANKEIDIETIKKYINSKEEREEKRRRLDVDIPEAPEEVVERQEFRTYDINSVLEDARENKEIDYEEQRHRKLNNKKELKEKVDEENATEKTIVDLIQDIQLTSKGNDVNDLFSDLISDNENTVVMAPINEDEINKNNMKETLANITMDLEKIKEPINDATQDLLIEKEKLKMEKEKELEETMSKTNTSKISSIDKSFYTNSMSFTKTDFEGFEDIEKGTNIYIKIGIAAALILLIITILLIINFAK